MLYCKCMDVRHLGDAAQDIRDETIEFAKEPSLDELSDIAFGIGRLVAGLFGKVYVHIPGDGLHVAKIDARMSEYGCVRSHRHAVVH